MRLIDCDVSQAEPILAIFNEAIEHSTALYEYQPRTLATMRGWFAAKQAGSYPVVGAIGPDSQFLGFASYGPFRALPAYKYTVEHSVYVAAPYRGQGVGRRLLQEILDRAQRQQYHLLVGVIDAQNSASIALHRKFGFTHAGTLRQAGFKFGRWLDVEFYQRALPTPDAPQDG